MTCTHPPHKLEDGPRVPARYGTLPTTVCACGMYRTGTRDARNHNWMPGPPDTTEDDDA